MPLQPTVLWAQRKDRLFLTIDLQDCKDPKVTLDSDDNHGTVSFRGHATSHATGALSKRNNFVKFLLSINRNSSSEVCLIVAELCSFELRLRCVWILLSSCGHNSAGPEEHSYILDLQLYGPIDKEDTKISQTDRTILLVIAKKGEDFWPRLLKQPGKTSPNIKVIRICHQRSGVL